MTIKEKILEGLIIATEERLGRLIEMNAPQVVTEGIEKQIHDYRTGSIIISGDIECLQDAFETVESRKGKGGKQYLVFNGHINFFPSARYGMYIKNNKEER